MTQLHYLAIVTIELVTTAENLEFKVEANYKQTPPNDVREIVSILIAKMPLVITKGWFELLNQVPEINKGFIAHLHLNFFIDDEGEWAVNGHTEQKEGIEPLLLGISKMIFTEDPAIEALLAISEEKPEQAECLQPSLRKN